MEATNGSHERRPETCNLWWRAKNEFNRILKTKTYYVDEVCRLWLSLCVCFLSTSVPAIWCYLQISHLIIISSVERSPNKFCPVEVRDSNINSNYRHGFTPLDISVEMCVAFCHFPWKRSDCPSSYGIIVLCKPYIWVTYFHRSEFN